VVESGALVLTTQSGRPVFLENTQSCQYLINTRFQQTPLLQHFIFQQGKLILQHRNHPFLYMARSYYGVNFTPFFATVSTTSRCQEKSIDLLYCATESRKKNGIQPPLSADQHSHKFSPLPFPGHTESRKTSSVAVESDGPNQTNGNARKRWPP